MKVSADPYSPHFFGKLLETIEVYIDGKPSTHILEADDQTNEITEYVTDGKTVKVDENGRPETRTRTVRSVRFGMKPAVEKVDILPLIRKGQL